MTTTLNPPDVKLTQKQRTVLEALATEAAGLVRLSTRTLVTSNGTTVSGQAARNLAAHGLAAIIDTCETGTDYPLTVAVITPLGHAYLELTCPHCGLRPDQPSPAIVKPRRDYTPAHLLAESDAGHLATPDDLAGPGWDEPPLPLATSASASAEAVSDRNRGTLVGHLAADDLLRGLGIVR